MNRMALLLALVLMAGTAAADPAPILIGFVTQPRAAPERISPLDPDLAGEGIAGARLALADNSTTGKFTGQAFALIELDAGDDPADAIRQLKAQGVRLVVSDLDAPMLEALASSPEAGDLTFINSRAPDDALRNGKCRANVLHTIASRAMLADGLAQYLAAKGWRRWFLVTGATEGDRLLADAFRRAAHRFGTEIAVEAQWTFKAGHARTDTGHASLQSEIPVLTRAGDHDVLVVADENGEFGDYLPGRTAMPRPVAGTHGLVATGWSPVSEQWGAMQLQNRFQRMAGRRMTGVDYAAWAAVRAIGEAALRARTGDPTRIVRFLRSPDFMLSGYKGQGQSFRAWDGQMRQPVLIAGPRLLVSVSPQPGFLHRGSELDTLGFDQGETQCAL